MPTFRVIRKSDQAEVYQYANDVALDLAMFPFADYDHVPVTDVPVEPELPASAWYVYPGPFKDRLGVDGLAIAASTHPVCVAAREMLSGRLYIDLRGAKAAGLLDMLIATQQPAASPYFPGSGPMTAEKKAAILGAPASDAEVYRG